MNDINRGILDVLTVYRLFKPEQVVIDDILDDSKEYIIGFEVIIDDVTLFQYWFKGAILQYGLLAHDIKERDVMRIKNEILELYIESVRQNENRR